MTFSVLTCLARMLHQGCWMMAPGEAEERNGPVDHFAAERVRQGGRTLGSQTPQERKAQAGRGWTPLWSESASRS